MTAGTWNAKRDSLLPDQRTLLELALEAVGHVSMFDNIDITGLSSLYDIDNVPAVLLPWLAWQFGLDVWDPNWTEEQQREALRNLASTMLRRGTVQSVRDAVAPWGAQLEIVEWWQPNHPAPGTQPYTFIVRVFTGTGELGAIRAAINRTMPVRCHYTLQPGEGLRATIGVGAIVRTATYATMSATI